MKIRVVIFISMMLFVCRLNANAQQAVEKRGDLLLGISAQIPGPGINWIRIVDGGSYENMYSPEFGSSLSYRMPITNRFYVEPEIEYTVLFFDDQDENYDINLNFINFGLGFPIDLTKSDSNNFYLVPGFGYTTSFYKDRMEKMIFSESGVNIFLKYIYSGKKTIDFGLKTKLVKADYEYTSPGKIWQSITLVNELRITFKLF